MFQLDIAVVNSRPESWSGLCLAGCVMNTSLLQHSLPLHANPGVGGELRTGQKYGLKMGQNIPGG
eukprot:1159445-Pelagomonas_calceolata.AAC.10